ncbi:aminopeptidase P family protein [Ruminococcaceae bacterium OttesenSCG-928-D13]|nr:aminopeptidase P family protein [Ruminococcaceae bacterium OttesenSCG-928-D13]
MNERAKKLVAAMPAGFEAAYIGTEANRFYLLDFDAGDAGHLLVLPNELVYIIDSRYIEIAQREITDARVVLEEDAMAQLAAELKAAGATRLYLEDGMPIAGWNRLKGWIPGVEYDVTSTLGDTLVGLRQIKDAEELARMRKAQQITDACFTHILSFIKPGVREIDLMLEMEHFMRSHGAEKLAFDTICVAGPNTSLPHGVPGEYKVQPGDFITMDFGAKYKGYCADMTRTVALGEPGEEKRKVYDTVLKAHLAGIEAACAGKTGKDVDKVARDLIGAAGYAGAFGHGLGHAVGIDVHEDPRFSPKCADIVRAGMMMTVEPGIYLAGKFGCRIEDMVLITEDGCEPMPTSEKQLIIL